MTKAPYSVTGRPKREGSQSNRPQKSNLQRSLLIALMLGAAVLLGDASVSAQEDVKDCKDPNQPCFQNNPDILSGRRHLLRTDDLVLSLDRKSGSDSSHFANYLMNTSNLQVINQTAYGVVTPHCDIDFPAPSPISTRVGRVFNLKNDVIVSLAPKDKATGTDCGGGVGELALYVHDPIDDSANGSITPLGFAPAYTRMAMDDFDYDGHADVVLVGPFFNASFTLMEVYSARDVDDPSGGMLFKKSLNLGEVDSPRVPRGEPVTGDFNGDGAIDVAWAGAENEGLPLSIYFASICPEVGFKIVSTTCSDVFEIVLSPESILTGIPWFPDIFQAALSAGDFDGAASPVTGFIDDELLFLRKTEVKKDSAKLLVEAFNFTPDLKAIKAPDSLTIEPVLKGVFFNHPLSLFHVASGRLDWTASREQAVIGTAIFTPVPISPLAICTITFSTVKANDLAMTSHCLKATDDTLVTMYGLAIGRFYPPDVDGEIDFNQQIVGLFTEWNPSKENTRVDIYTVDPTAKKKDGFVPKFHSEHTIADEILLAFDHRVHAPLQVGDLQGNSLVLGAPDIVKISGHIEPSIVLGVPPMHADFISRMSGVPPSLVNVSIDPSNDQSTSEESDYDATYKFSSSTNTSTTHQSKTSSTLSTKETLEGKVSLGAAGNDVSVTVKGSAKQFSSKVVSNKHVFKKSIASKVQATTGLGDLVWFDIKDFYIYVYPVIGQTVCPNNKATCNETDKVPMHVQFSGPDDVKTSISSAASDVMVMSGHNMEWYQPVHEPGNLLTYPWNKALLMERLTGKNPKAPKPQELAKSAEETLKGAAFINQTNWSQSTSTDKSTGSAEKYTEDASISVAAKTSFLFGVGKASAKASFDVKGSDSTQTLTTSISTVASSEGIDVTVPTFDGPSTWALQDFEYNIQTYIFGEQVPEGTLDDVKAHVDLSTNGTQRTSYVPVATATNWFKSYNLPDLALNHPVRWSWDEDTLVASFNRPNLVSADTSRFYAMRGFFVTPQDTTGVSPVGPLLTQLTADEVLTLWTRVYNMSLAAFEPSATAYVRIFGQVFDSTSPTCQEKSPPGNCQFVGPSFEVGTQTFDASLLNSYPDKDAAINNDPNWRMIKQDWSTEPDAENHLWGCGPVGSKVSCGGKELVFWVLVWAQDGTNVQLASEMAGHGLSAIPSDMLNNIADVPLEKVTYEGESRTFSNNVGLYNQTFYVCDTTQECEPSSEAFAATRGLEGDLLIEGVSFDAETVKLHDSIRVDARIATTEQPFAPINVFFYDGDPADKDRMPFDHEHIPFVGSNNKYVTSSRFEPRTCGLQEIHVVMAAIGRPPVTDFSMIEVTADPVVEVGLIMDSVKRFEINHKIELSLLENLAHAQKDFRKDLTSDATRHLNTFSDQVRTQTGGKIPLSSGQSLIAQVDRLMGCLG